MFTVVDANIGELIKVFDVKETPDGICFLTFNCGKWKYIPSENYIPVYEFTKAEEKYADLTRRIARGDFYE